MSFSDLILTLLDKRNLEFELQCAPEAVSLREDWLAQTVPLAQVARVSILQDPQGLVLAFFPDTQQLNLSTLKSVMARELRFIDTDSVITRLSSLLQRPDFQPGVQNGIQIIVDEALTNHDIVYFEAPRPCTVLRLGSDQLGMLADDVLLGSRFSEPRVVNPRQPINEKSAINLKQRIAKLERLPAMPDMPARLLALRNNPNSTVEELVALVAKDPSLAAQIIRYANSAMFRHESDVTSLTDAIDRVLGYDTVLHLTLGYALGRVFKLPSKGPLGSNTYWQNATHSAALAQQLAQAMPSAKRLKPGMAYLAGLLHNIGFLVLNLFFKSEFEWLNKIMIANPTSSILAIEQRLLGITHMELGAWLMRAWNMPGELTAAVEHHHSLDYRGTFAEYAHLINLTERLLKMHAMSDAETDEIPTALLEELGLHEEQVYLIMDTVLQGGPLLREMAKTVSA
jgi:HD-like signal output (HDOD) protein/prolyl-tRNA editing enzyme YbaK/EbsC (Cys-tRNA(Pro) deacylase)